MAESLAGAGAGAGARARAGAEAGAARLCRDMDDWGYSFRLGSAARWFAADAEDARRWLEQHGLIDAAGRITRALRQ